LEYRLRLLTKWDAVWSDCLRLAGQKAGWGKALPKGEGLGVAITSWPTASMRNSSTVICAAVRVAVSPSGELQVKTIDVALDCGRMANKDAVLSAVEGGIIFGLNMTLNEGLTVKDGAIVEGNFDEAPMLRMADMPKLRVHFEAMTGQDRMDIVGESAVGPVGPAVGNAIFAATGKRVRTTPFRKADLSWG
jgi:isoquinoline 1-oxidoreductase beta subunit